MSNPERKILDGLHARLKAVDEKLTKLREDEKALQCLRESLETELSELEDLFLK